MKKQLIVVIACVLLSSPAWAALAEVQHKTATTIVSGNTVAVTVTALGSGNLVIVGAMGSGSETITGVSDGSNTYVQATSCRALSVGGRFTDVWYAKNSTSGPTTVTVTFSATNTNRREAYVQEVSGADTSAPFDNCGTATGTGSDCPGTTSNWNCTGAADTTSAANTYIIGIMRTSGVCGNTGAGGGFTNDDASSAGCAVHRIVSSAATYTPIYNQTSGTQPSDQAYSTASFKAPSAGGVKRLRGLVISQ